ncbi:MAG: glycosyltransferase family 39 protein [Acidobacteriia bacterium]|nr:glycosyltransferase family 39 protein [Terriglobia bacterium]
MTTGTTGLSGRSRFLGACLPLLLLLSIARLWLMPMRSSLWVDEMGTVFVVRQGPDDPSLRVAPQVPESIYYLLPRGAEALLGFSEVTYRLPSLLAMAAALFLIARLATRLIHPQAGWFAAFACMALRGIDYQAADARPYGLGTLVACASLWFLVRWLDCGGWRDALLFVVFAALLWRVQLIFWPFYLVFGIYALVRLARRGTPVGETPVGMSRAALVFALLALALLPVAIKALALYRQAGGHVIVALPSARDLVLSLKLGLIAVCGAGAWLLSRVFRWRPDSPTVSRSSFSLLLAWWLCPPFCLFGFSWLTGHSVFVARYLWLALPGGALVAVLAASRFIPAAQWTPLAAALGVGVLLWNGQWDHVWPPHHNSDWRGAARTIQELGMGPETPVICPSPFIEAKPPAWRPEYPLSGFLYTHLSVYPFPGRIYPLPFEDSPEAEEFAGRLAGQVLAVSKRFVLYGGQGQVGFWRDWFRARPELAGWSNEQSRTFGDVEVVVFEKPAR